MTRPGIEPLVPGPLARVQEKEGGSADSLVDMFIEKDELLLSFLKTIQNSF